MGWVKHRGILVHVGTFSEPDERELVPYGHKMPPADNRGRPRAACGTESAYRRHQRHGEDVCDACREARSQARKVKP